MNTAVVLAGHAIRETWRTSDPEGALTAADRAMGVRARH